MLLDVVCCGPQLAVMYGQGGAAAAVNNAPAAQPPQSGFGQRLVLPEPKPAVRQPVGSTQAAQPTKAAQPMPANVVAAREMKQGTASQITERIGRLLLGTPAGMLQSQRAEAQVHHHERMLQSRTVHEPPCIQHPCLRCACLAPVLSQLALQAFPQAGFT